MIENCKLWELSEDKMFDYGPSEGKAFPVGLCYDFRFSLFVTSVSAYL